MRRYLSFASIVFLLLIVSCKKEKSFEQGKPSKGSIQDSVGDCLSKDIVGLYKAGQTLSDSNYIDVTVSVTQPGSYVIFTDTVNGYYFRSTGNFASAGTTTVRLKGFGTPGSAGNDDLTIFYDSSFCLVTIPVMTSGSSSGGTAVLSLSGSGGTCMNDSVYGIYTQGVALTALNKVNIEVNVTTPGTWIMGTNTAGGISFYNSGNFTSTGIQIITLDGVGTPSAAGTQTFTVTAGTSTCTFTVIVKPGAAPPPNSGDYFPRTVGSHWTYMFDGDPTDTLRWDVISQTKTVSGNTYNIFMQDDGLSVDTLGYYRKSGGDYFQWGNVSDIYGFDNPLYAEWIMLKDNQAAGFSWTSSSFAGTLSGIAATFRNKFTITQKNVTITSNGIQYPNTIVVKFEVQVSAGATWVSYPQYYLFYYTKNYGVTKVESFDANNALIEKLELMDYKVF